MPDMPEEQTVETQTGDGAVEGFTPPYIPFKTLLNLIQRMADEGMPDRINRSYLGFQSGIMQTYLIKTLRSLDLIRGDQGEVTDRLRALVSSPEERPRLIGALLREYYPQALGLGNGATHGQLDEVFTRQYDLTGDTKRKALTFYLNAAQFAGLPLSRYFKMPRSAGDTSKPRASNGQRRSQRRRQVTPTPEPSAAAVSLDSLRTRYVQMLLDKADSQEELDDNLLNRIEALLGFDVERDQDEPEE
jgi:hypothetical protein